MTKINNTFALSSSFKDFLRLQYCHKRKIRNNAEFKGKINHSYCPTKFKENNEEIGKNMELKANLPCMFPKPGTTGNSEIHFILWTWYKKESKFFLPIAPKNEINIEITIKINTFDLFKYFNFLKLIKKEILLRIK